MLNIISFDVIKYLLSILVCTQTEKHFGMINIPNNVYFNKWDWK